MIGRREFGAAAFAGAGLLALDTTRLAQGGDIIAKPKDNKDNCDSPPLSDSGGALNHAAIAGACSASY